MYNGSVNYELMAVKYSLLCTQVQFLPEHFPSSHCTVVIFTVQYFLAPHWPPSLIFRSGSETKAKILLVIELMDIVIPELYCFKIATEVGGDNQP
jgi:hypothetical protein